MIQTPQQTRKSITSRLPAPDDDFDFLQPQIDLLQTAFHLLFSAVTPKSSLHDMLEVSRVLSYTADQYSRLLKADFPPLTGENPLIDWDGIFERIWTMDLERPSPFLPHWSINH